MRRRRALIAVNTLLKSRPLTSEVIPMEGYSRQYWANVTGKLPEQFGPFESREAAIEEALRAHPNARTITSGYGTEGAWFDIQFTRNPNKED